MEVTPIGQSGRTALLPVEGVNVCEQESVLNLCQNMAETIVLASDQGNKQRNVIQMHVQSMVVIHLGDRMANAQSHVEVESKLSEEVAPIQYQRTAEKTAVVWDQAFSPKNATHSHV